MDNRIRLLDDNTANRIAAGEVVERPASAVKELVENAIDAGASRIVIVIEEGGKRRIEVADDGCGMGREDAVLALQRHATSKIESADDLFAIRTLGFRGEALPSIASVSHMVLATKTPDDPAGTRIVVHGGDIESIEEIGGRDGTVVVVEDLFYNTPARLKFLKSTPTEVARAVEAVGHLAIAHARIAFRVKHGAQEVFSTPGGGDPVGALAAVWGRDVARQLIPVRHDTPGLKVTGYVCTPDVNRPGRSHELFYVNGRPIRSRLLGHALEDAFRSLTPESRYPVAAIFVEISPELVDVNVHPTKTEVKFTRDGDVHHAAGRAVKDALLRHGIVPTFAPGGATTSAQGTWAGAPGTPAAQVTLPGSDFADLARTVTAWPAGAPPTGASNAPSDGTSADGTSADGTSADGACPGASGTPSDGVPAGAPGGASRTLDALADAAARISAGEISPDPAMPAYALSADAAGAMPARPFQEQLRGFRVIGQARNTYIVAITDQGLAIIDQHVAHERVLYERLTVKRMEQGIPSQRLVVPLTLALGTAESALLTQRLPDFAAAGWDIEAFGRDTFLVRAVPSYAARREYEALLRDMVDELVHQSVARRLIVQRDHVTITNACKMAVKAGDPLTMEEMTGLLAQLADTENPYMCPHGRPIIITLPFGEIDRRFKR